MLKKKVAVLVSGGGTNLQAIINAEKKGIISSGTVSLVVSNNPDAYALKRAQRAGIKTLVVTKKQEGSQEKFEDKLISALKDEEVSLIVLAGFMSILSEKFTKTFENKIINVHPSLIPSFCGKGYYGLRVHQEALRKGVKVTGATVHYVNEIPDGGEIIAQKAVYVKDGDTPELLQKRVMKSAEWKLLPKAIEEICSK